MWKFGPNSTKIVTLVGVDNLIIQSNFGFNIFKGFRSTGEGGVKISIFPLTLLAIVTTQQCCRYRAACDIAVVLPLFGEIKIFVN